MISNNSIFFIVNNHYPTYDTHTCLKLKIIFRTSPFSLEFPGLPPPNLSKTVSPTNFWMRYCDCHTISPDTSLNVMLCAICYHSLKNAKHNHGRVLLSVKLQVKVTLSQGFLTFLKLYKWYQIAQTVSNHSTYVTQISI